MITQQMVEEVLRTLPIGYYLGRRVPVVLDTASATSFVNLATQEIHVAVANIEAAIGKMKKPTTADIEAATRCALYHELSHVLLTHNTLFAKYTRNKTEKDIFNALEDARIEKILGNYYMGVNFPWFIRAITGGEKDASKARSLLQYIFCIVRYRKGPASLIAEWDSLVAAHRETAVEYPFDLAMAYKEFIYRCKVARAQPEQQPQPQEQPQESQDSDGDGNGEGTQEEDSQSEENQSEQDEAGDEDGGEGEAGEEDEPEEDGEDGKDGEAEEQDGEEQEAEGEDESEAGDDEAGDDGEGDGGEVSEDEDGEEEDEDGEEEEQQDPTALPPPTREEIAQTVERVLDPTGATAKTEEALRHTIFRALRKAGMTAGRTYDYSGRVDARAVARRGDYRWFAKSSGGEARKGTRLHLTLCVDCSGSFSTDVRYVNGMIAALNKLEKTTPDFSFDILRMEYGAVKWDKRTPLVAEGGNFLNGTLADGIKATARQGWRNMTLAVWDGIFHVPWFWNANESQPDAERDLKALNNRDTIIVSDTDNTYWLTKFAPQARTQIISDDYAETFIDKVCELLDGAI